MYIVVENAGYEGERDVKKFSVYQFAFNWLRKNYSHDEQDNLHVAICRETANGRTYEF